MNISPDNVSFFRDVWSNLKVPVRPGPEGLELYRKEMEKFADKQVLVLGATPELVDMAVRLGASRVVSIERNPEIMAAMRQIGREDWSSVELVVGNWLDDRSAFHGAFNYIACDGGLLFLDYPGQWNCLFELVYTYLTPGGAFVAKEWAEPKSAPDYEIVKARLLEAFDKKLPDLDDAQTIEAFIRMASELRLAAFIGVTNADGSFVQAPLVSRLNALFEELKDRYPDPVLVSIARGALIHLARSRPGTTDTVTGVRYKGAETLLTEQGFRVKEHSLPDAPVPGGNYMFAARK